MTSTFVEKVAREFRRNRFRWIRAERLMRVGGNCAWRTRISDARRLYNLPIENRVRQVGKYRISEYKCGRRKKAA